MFDTFRKTAFTALAGLVTLGGVSAASAEGLHFGIDRDGGARFGITVDDGDRDGRRWGRDDRNGRRWDRQGPRLCTAERALDKAQRLGVRRARVVDIDRRTIDVAGRRHGERIFLTFARAPHCPVIR